MEEVDIELPLNSQSSAEAITPKMYVYTFNMEINL